ncbi:MAG: hypothetical protein ACI837_002218 [Crocinitomicaceae bacterium]|jgi:hypothetical protein
MSSRIKQKVIVNQSLFVLLAVTLLNLSSCSNNSAIDESLDPDIVTEVEAFFHGQDFSWHEHEKFVGIDWNSRAIESADSTIYPFALIWERDGKEYPFKHRAILKNETLEDIMEYSSLFNSWVSLLPIVYNVRDEDWWLELSEEEGVLDLTFDECHLELLDSTHNYWREVFVGNVILKIERNVLAVDTLFWYPKLSEIIAPNCKITRQNESGETTMIGAEFSASAPFKSWVLGKIEGMKVVERVD